MTANKVFERLKLKLLCESEKTGLPIFLFEHYCSGRKRPKLTLLSYTVKVKHAPENHACIISFLPLNTVLPNHL